MAFRQNLISSSSIGGNNWIYTHSGISSTLLGSFQATAGGGRGISFDTNENLISTEQNNDKYFFQHSGISNTILGSFVGPPSGAALVDFRGINMLSGNVMLTNNTLAVAAFYTNSGLSDVTTGSFALPEQFTGEFDFDSNGDMVSLGTDTDYIYFHSGVSSVLTGSFEGPGTGFKSPFGIVLDQSGNMIIADTFLNHIYIYDGLNDTITGSFQAPGAFAQGLTLENLDPTYTITTVVSPAGAGSILTQEGDIASGTVVGISGTANNGYAFDQWTGDLTGTANPTTITMDDDKIISGNFLEYFTLTTVSSPASVGNLVSPLTGSYISGTTVTVTGSETAVWEFDQWTGDLTGTTNPDDIVINQDKVVSGNYVRRTLIEGIYSQLLVG